MSAEPGSLLAAFLIGLAGLAHCGPMCGGIQGALTQAVDPSLRQGQRPSTILLAGYNLGRISSYTLAGALAGSLGALAAPAAPLLRIIAALLLIAIGLQVAGIARWLDWLEAGGRHVWKYLHPVGRRFIPVRHPAQALALGALWGWLPCGLVYSVLSWAAAQGSPLQGALIMLCFGVGTLPALFATAVAMEQIGLLAQRRAARLGTGLLVAGFGVWTLLGSLQTHGPHDPGMAHDEHSMHQQLHIH